MQHPAVFLLAVYCEPRPATTLEKLAALQPILGAGTSITAGNSSGINDGACALLLASDAAVARWNLVPRARVLGMAAAGVEPRVMGIGPVAATTRLLARLRLKLADFDLVEINEAFAAQVLAVTRALRLADYEVVEINEAFAAQVLSCARALGLPDDAEHVNPNGGAIALGHPLGASGLRLLMTAALEMKRREAPRALVSLCVGVGQGLALSLERAQ